MDDTRGFYIQLDCSWPRLDGRRVAPKNGGMRTNIRTLYGSDRQWLQMLEGRSMTWQPIETAPKENANG